MTVITSPKHSQRPVVVVNNRSQSASGGSSSLFPGILLNTTTNNNNDTTLSLSSETTSYQTFVDLQPSIGRYNVTIPYQFYNDDYNTNNNIL